MKSNLDAAKRMARILGITVSRCKEMLKAGNQAGLHTVYMLASVQAYTKRKTRRKAWSGGKKPPTPTIVTAQCMGCGAKRDIRAGEIPPVGDHPCCESCGMPMIAIHCITETAKP